MKKFISSLLTLLIAFIIISCGGSSDDSSTPNKPTTQTIKGTVYDDLIVGLPYETKGFKGEVTNDLGEFNYISGEVKFYLGTLFLGSIQTMPEDKKVFLSDILTLKRGDYTNPKLLKTAQLLQSLDLTSSEDKKIILDTNKIKELFNTPNQNLDTLNLKDLNLNLVSQEEAKKRVKATYTQQNITPLEPINPDPDPKPEPDPEPEPINQTPKANAGKDITTQKGVSVTLDGSNSTDDDTLSYKWLNDKNQTLSTKKIFDLNTSLLSNYGLHVITLEVKDTNNQTSKDSINITLLNPKFLSSTPKHDERNVSKDTNITIKFNFPMVLDISKFTLMEDQKPIPLKTLTREAILSSKENNTTFIINPLKNLSDDIKKYTLTINKELKDSYNNSLEKDINISFYTKDTIKPQILNTYPTNNQENIPTTSDINITFTEKVSPSTLTEENIILTNTITNTKATLKKDTSKNPTIILKPNTTLDENTTYKLTLKEIQDLYTNKIDQQNITFKTKDETKPTITDINIKNNQTNIPTDTNITITFSEELNASTITKDNIHVNHNFDYNLTIKDNKTITITPTNKFDENQTYILTIKDIQDKSGNTLQDKNITTFTTADETKPTIKEINIENNQTNIPTDTNITITFSEPMNEDTLKDKANYIFSQTLDFTIQLSSSNTITITPTNKFDENQTYTLTIKDIQDKSGNTLQDTNTTTFTTADETAPTIEDINLQKDTTNLHVSINETFNISFSEELNSSTKTDNFTLIKGATPIDINFTKNNENNVTIKPTNNLDFNTTYTLHVKNIKDPSGNTLTEQTYTFKTQERYYISEDANGTGTTWQDALNISNIQTAIDNAKDKNISIWFQKGTYKPNATINIKNSVKLYGGFKGNETNLNQRNLTKENNTTLSGDNKIRVLSTDHVNKYTILDGFYVVEGKVTGYGNDGAGMNNNDSNITISNVTFSQNSASNNGGGMYNNNSNPTLTNVTFSANSTSGFGGGMYNNRSNPTLTNVTFSANSANEGGGMNNYSNSNPILINVTFSENSSMDGGGMRNKNSNPILANVTFSENSASNYGKGGGIYNHSSSPTLINVTFSENSARYGGGMFNDYSNLTLTNTIIWLNTAGNGANINNSNSTPTITNSIVQDLNLNDSLYKDKNNSTQDPLLTKNHKTINGVTHTYYELGYKSPALNKGKNKATTHETDQIGNKRVANSQIDIGAIEMPESNPYIINITPQNNEANVSLDTNITITFSEPMKKDTLIPDNFKLVDDTNTTITLDENMFTFNETNSTLTINPDENLTINKIYTLTIKKEITDKNANALEENPRRFSTSSTPLPRFTRDNTNKIVTDWQENRIWQDEVYTQEEKIAYINNRETGKAQHWENAKKYCENLTFGGYSDWHLPTKDELGSIVDKSRNPTINSAFKNVMVEGYWSSTAHLSNTSFAWGVVFDSGNDNWGTKSNTGYVRCVR